ncbi:MAG: hypothetical protein V4692_09705 [Bdellovibrionota bacterium]
MRILTFVFFAMIVSACGKVKVASSKSAGGTVFDSAEKGKDVTDTSMCATGFPATTALGNWRMVHNQNGVEVVTILQISQNATQVRNICRFETRAVEALVQIPSAVITSRKEIQFRDEADATVEEAGFKCSVAAKIEVIYYEFDGSCLSVRASNSPEAVTLIPNK